MAKVNLLIILPFGVSETELSLSIIVICMSDSFCERYCNIVEEGQNYGYQDAQHGRHRFLLYHNQEPKECCTKIKS